MLKTILILLLFSVLFFFFLMFLLSLRMPRYSNILRIFVGLPGAGKTTLAAAFAKNRLKHGHKVYSNVPIKGTFVVDKPDFGTRQLEDCEIEVDEAGIVFNNRVLLQPYQINWFKLHRHYGVGINFFSQRSDAEITIRSMAYELYKVKKSLIPFFVTYIRYPMSLQPTETRDNLAPVFSDPRRFRDTFRIFCPPLWKMFDSWDAPQLETKDDILWEFYNLLGSEVTADPEVYEKLFDFDQDSDSVEEDPVEGDSM